MTTTMDGFFSKFSKFGVGTPLILVAMIAMMILPLPPLVLDLLFTFNIAIAMVVVLASVYCLKPLDFAVFPTVLLVATLLRLVLNIASTRVVLLNGHTGTHAAGQVVESFGEVVVGGNFAVGLVVFAILMVINFVVVTKGAGRISEVSARFTLDALPGKQMAIDADLNAGLIDQDQAKARRTEVTQESDFYGAMDGASKFVRGDAIAGILILFINLIGGLFIGLLQHDMSFQGAVHNYSLLTIGDGLVAQVPSLLLSTAAAIIVTRVSRNQDMGKEILTQMFSNDKILYICAGVIFALGVIPGMPHFIFITLSLAMAVSTYYRRQKEQVAKPDKKAEEEKAVEENKGSEEITLGDVTSMDTIGLELGYRLISMVDNKSGSPLLDKIKGLRKKLSRELGFLLPMVHIKDNLDLTPNLYQVVLNGVTIGEGEIHPERYLAINPGQVFGQLEGIAGKDPAFGLDAIWIEEDAKEHAQSIGYTVVDASTVMTTHLSQVIEQNASEVFGHDDAQKLIDQLAVSAPKLVESLVPDSVPLSVLVKVLQELLKEAVPIRDIRTIAETLAEQSSKTKDPEVLTESVRCSLSRLIVQNIYGQEQDLSVMTLSPELEQILQQMMQNQGNIGLHMEPTMAGKLQETIQQLVEKNEMEGRPNVLVVQPSFRKVLSHFFKPVVSNLHVLSYVEIPHDKSISIVGSLG